MATNQPSQTNPRLTQIALAVKPYGMIADIVLPRVPVEAESFKYTVFADNTFFDIPDTSIGRKSEPNEVEFGGTLVDASTTDQGLSDVVPIKDVNQFKAGLNNVDPEATATEGTSILIDLAREQRAANFIFNAANYSASLKTTLSGTSQWSDPTSDPIADITNARDAMLVKPNKLVLGRKTASALQRHPKIVAAIYGKTGVGAAGTAAGIVSLQGLADLFELDQVIVGEAWFNNARKGQSTNMARLWGNHASLLRIDPAVRSLNITSIPSFACTAQWGTRRVRTVFDGGVGVDGANKIIIVEQVKEILLWQNAGFYFQNAVA